MFTRNLVRSTFMMSNSSSRLSVFRNHLCCGSAANVQRSPARSTSNIQTKADAYHPLSLQSTLNILQHVAGSSGKDPADHSLGKIMQSYTAFEHLEREEFLNTLARDYQCDAKTLSDSIENLRASRSAPNHKQQQRLRESLVAPYEVIFREIGSTKNGVKFLVDLRKDLISVVRKCTDTDRVSSLQAMNHDLKQVRLSYLTFGHMYFIVCIITWSYCFQLDF